MAESPNVVVLGAPLDLTCSGREGTASAPNQIRITSDLLETYSPELQMDLDDIVLADWGDLPLEGLAIDEALGVIQGASLKAIQAAMTVILGGEHTLSLGAIRAAKAQYPQLAVIQLDAHLDLRESYEGERICQATVFRRVIEELGTQSLIQLGVRSGTREEFGIARYCLFTGRDLALSSELRHLLRGRPLYLSIDLDVVDPAHAPGVSCPEPGGCSFTDLLRFLYSLHGLPIVAADIVEVVPPHDPAGVTSLYAAKMVREIALLFGACER